MNLRSKIKTHIVKVLLSLSVLVFLLNSCAKSESKAAFSPDFTFEFIDDNLVRFTNTTEGEYLTLFWDFGNGESEVTTSKTQKFEVYYPVAGSYDVMLTISGLDGNNGTLKKMVTIATTDFILDFSLMIDASNPNLVNLKNTTIGSFDSFMWIFRNKVIENQSQTMAYFPYGGSYNIELRVVKDGKSHSSVQTVTISGDDPAYFSKFNLVWAEEFEGDAINSGNWTFETGAGGWGNNELQNYTNGSNAVVKNGILTITAKKVDENKDRGSYTSTRLISKGKKEFTYGKIEIRAQLPSGKGIWPAIWMLASNYETVSWPACGEIDIMEYVGYQPNTIHATVHTAAGSGSNGSGSSKNLNTAEEEYHVYGLIWTEKEMIFYVDSPESITHRYAPTNKTADNWPFDKPQFLIVNVAVGGNWGGAQGIDNSIFPQSMHIDYVHVYQEM